MADNGALESLKGVRDIEEHVLRLLDELAADKQLAVDGRMLAIGRTHVELGFMAVCRSVTKLGRYEIDPGSVREEKGWALERADSSPATPLYWSAGDGHGRQWSADHHAAVRFARAADARKVAAAIGFEVRVAEHVWVTP